MLPPAATHACLQEWTVRQEGRAASGTQLHRPQSNTKLGSPQVWLRQSSACCGPDGGWQGGREDHCVLLHRRVNQQWPQQQVLANVGKHIPLFNFQRKKELLTCVLSSGPREVCTELQRARALRCREQASWSWYCARGQVLPWAPHANTTWNLPVYQSSNIIIHVKSSQR